VRYVLSAIIWTYGLILFALVLLVITLLACFFPPRVYNGIACFLLRFIVAAFGGRVKVEGMDNFDHKATFIFMPNHVSMFDIPLVGGYIPNLARGVQAAEQFKWPVFGWFITKIGNIPIERKSAHASMRSFQKAAEKIREGVSIIVMPEGTRTRTGKLGNFKTLPFHLAKVAKADIVPIGTSGLYRFKSRASWLITPGPIKIKFGKPIYFKETKDLTLEQLRDVVRERIAALIEFP
jgi:1-acyl-sn-glycerol-3-phosphate acyltransferase